jgi:hypothetical protein
VVDEHGYVKLIVMASLFFPQRLRVARAAGILRQA